MPTDFSSMPEYTEPPVPAKADEDEDAVECASNSSQASGRAIPEPSDFLDDAATRDGRPPPRRSKGEVNPLATACGTLPLGSAVQDFHQAPVHVHARNAEGRYWQDFSSHVQEAFPAPGPDTNVVVEDTSWDISSVDALVAAENQRLFFKSVDSFHFEPESIVSKGGCKPDKFDVALKGAVGRLTVDYVRSDTVVMEAAFFLLRSGLLNVPDVGTINVKQARAFLWNAAWLQEYMSATWREECPQATDAGKERKFQDFCLAIVGPGGTGKTAVLKMVEALTVFFAGPDTVHKLAPSNAAARLLGGDTLHALCKLPFGGARLTSKTGRLQKHTLRNHRKKWVRTIAAYLDEVSMISADQLLQCDVRLRQAKMSSGSPFGGLAMNICGDFLQLPPVDKDGSKKSLAMSHDDAVDLENEPEDAATANEIKKREEKLLEGRQGWDLWRSITRVVSLDVNVRAPGVLGRLQSEMRAGRISDAMWDLYMSRVITPQDSRLTDADSPFANHDVHFIVHRHRIRTTRSLENAKSHSSKLGTPLYVVTANDEAVYPEDRVKMVDAVRRELFERVNPEKTKQLPSFLPLYVGMRLLLSSKDCVRFGIMKGCPCILRDIVFADGEVLPSAHVAGHAHSLTFMPVSLILQAEGVEWTLPATELPGKLPKNLDRRGLFQLRPTYDYLRAHHEDAYFSVRRTTFLAMPADTITVYAAQGSTYDAVVADMQRPPNYDTAKHWLACYVMLSRARSLEGFLVLRPATRKELAARPPQYLLDELDRLLKVVEPKQNTPSPTHQGFKQGSEQGAEQGCKEGLLWPFRVL